MAQTGAEVKLLGQWPSPFAMRVKIALNIKNLQYEYIEETMNPKSDLLLKSNPVHKQIPVLIHDDKPISESLIIVQYTDEVWSSGPSILPSDPYNRAIERFWAAYIDEKLCPSIWAVLRAQGEEAKAAVFEKVKEGLALLEDGFNNCSKGKAFFGGDTIGYLDIALGGFLGWFKVYEKMNNIKLFDEAKTPGLVAWTEKFCANDAVKGALPDIDKMIEFANVLIAKHAAAAAAAATI